MSAPSIPALRGFGHATRHWPFLLSLALATVLPAATGIIYGRVFNAQLNANYQAMYRVDSATTTETTANTGIRYLAARQLWNASVGFKLTKNFEVVASGRNIFNEPSVQYSNVRGRIYLYDVYGSMWNVSLRGTF